MSVPSNIYGNVIMGSNQDNDKTSKALNNLGKPLCQNYKTTEF